MQTASLIRGGLLALFVFGPTVVQATEEIVESSFSHGTVRWTHATNGVVQYRIEWACSPTSSVWYDTGCGLAPTGTTMASTVPRFFRVAVCPVPTNMTRLPGGMISGTNLLAAGESHSTLYPETYNLTVESFCMDQYEVTLALWNDVRAWAVTNGYSFRSGSGKATNHPVYWVDWYDCVKWCNARSQKEGREPAYYTDAAFTWVYKAGLEPEPFVKPSANGYRLPTADQWEYAARGGLSSRRFPWGDTIQHARSNYRSNMYDIPYDTSPTYKYHPDYDNDPTPYTSPVGCFAPNGYGLYDMAGNVEEWVFDWHPDTVGIGRMVRGGHWGSYADRCRVGHRWGNFIDYEGNDVGLRTVVLINP
ncbi:MAG: formylglycine-generating enzyme family protein [Kiritimatiellae bacterium]|nr:formylglycine-generating enzyme family protein [Kiritimatiellia bacterium]